MAAPKRSTAIWATVLLGLCIALALTKLGNPIIFETAAYHPQNLTEILVLGWPMSWGYAVVIPAILLSALTLKFRSTLPKWFLALPALWLFWVILSSTRSVAPDLSRMVVMHLFVTVALFYAGLFVLGNSADDRFFWRILLFAFVYILWVGFDQHNGGLEATRKAFYEQPNWQSASKDFILRIESNRIFSIFIYANAFAGAILLWAPALTVILWDWTSRWHPIVQKVVVGLFMYLWGGCFYWTGSKAGWLIAIAVIGVALLHLKIKRAIKVGIVAGVLVLGLAGFAIKYRSYFEKGATSAGARIVYWQAALKIANGRPILGAGPGTFAKTFAPIKPPEAEMARLTHNDYLEQACDSGWPAFLLFGGFVWAGIILAHKTAARSPLHFAVWLGLLGWALQSFVEFGLYLPAIAWSAFLLMGWILASRNAIDTPQPAR